MGNRAIGWLGFLGALGMMASLMSGDVAKLHDWGEITTPNFVATILAHFGAVVLAFISGKVIPSPIDKEDRITSLKLNEINKREEENV